MTLRPTEEQEIQAQIEAAADRLFSTSDIEARIAHALLKQGEFKEKISAADLEVILHNIVYVMFANQTVAGREIGMLHNVPIMKVKIDGNEAFVDFVVHIHKPIIVFLEFKYSLVNQNEDGCQSLCLKKGSLRIKEKTRRFDVKAKAALTAMNVPKIARQEMSNLTNVIRHTLPDQLQKKGIQGELQQISLFLNDHTLSVHLIGEFQPLSGSAQV